jgi:hypothetical protein
VGDICRRGPKKSTPQRQRKGDSEHSVHSFPSFLTRTFELGNELGIFPGCVGVSCDKVTFIPMNPSMRILDFEIISDDFMTTE